MSENKVKDNLMKAYKACSVSFSQKEKYLDIYKRLLEKESKEQQKDDPPAEGDSEPIVEKKSSEAKSSPDIKYKQVKSEQDSISFSCNLAYTFETLMKCFNSSNKGKRVKLASLRNAFIGAARQFEKNKIDSKKKTNFCLACVNLYLREKVEGKESDLSEVDYIRASWQVSDFGLAYDFDRVDDLYITY
jgi:hypothetical protein